MKVPRYRWFLWAAFLAAALLFALQMGFLPGQLRPAGPRGFELLDSLFRHIRNDYLEERDPLLTAEGAYRGLVNSLDPLSAYLSKELAARYESRTGKEAEPGLVILKRYGAFPQVMGVVENSPAAVAGLEPGDILSAIAGRNALSMSLVEAELLLRGTDERPVKVRRLRGNETSDLDLARAVLFPEPFTFEQPAGRPAGLRVHRFTPDLVSGLRRKVVPALKGRKSPLVVDLRNCHDGGYGEARDFVNLFVQASDAGRFEKRGGAVEAVSCPAEPALGATPIAVWVNAGTMGPAEFAAGLLQEVRKAKVVGFPTPGLAGTAELYTLKDDSAVLLTSGVYILPSGRKLWEEGLRPDVALTVGQLDEKTYLEKTLAFLPKL